MPDQSTHEKPEEVVAEVPEQVNDALTLARKPLPCDGSGVWGQPEESGLIGWVACPGCKNCQPDGQNPGQNKAQHPANPHAEQDSEPPTMDTNEDTASPDEGAGRDRAIVEINRPFIGDYCNVEVDGREVFRVSRVDEARGPILTSIVALIRGQRDSAFQAGIELGEQRASERAKALARSKAAELYGRIEACRNRDPLGHDGEAQAKNYSTRASELEDFAAALNTEDTNTEKEQGHGS